MGPFENTPAPEGYRLSDRYVLHDGRKHPFAVICPGGAYRMIAASGEGEPPARRLNELGVSAFILWYRVGEDARFPAPQDDLARAVGEILSRAEEYDVLPEGYAVWGFSAGGHLAATFGTEALGYKKYGLPKPGAMVLAYPVITMEQGTHTVTCETLLGKDASMELRRFVSVDTQVTADYPPTYLWYGEEDASVSPENSLRMARALRRCGVRCICESFPGVGHAAGSGIGTAAEGWIDTAARFWLNG